MHIKLAEISIVSSSLLRSFRNIDLLVCVCQCTSKTAKGKNLHSYYTYERIEGNKKTFQFWKILEG